jgi:YVTN family beta-propeller protein
MRVTFKVGLAMFVLAITISTQSYAASKVVSIPVGTVPLQVGLNVKTNRIYVANLNSNNVSVIDGNTDTVIATVSVGNSPVDVGVNSVTNMIYVPNSGDNTVSVIDGASNTVVATIGGLSVPFRLGVNTETNQIFVSNFNSNTVSVFSGKDNTLVATVPVGNGPAGVKVNSLANLIYISNLSSGTISVIDGSTDTVSKTYTLPVGASPGNIALDPVSNQLFLTDGFNLVVYAVDAASGKLLQTIAGGKVPFKAPSGVAMFQPGKTILVSDNSSLNAVVEFSQTTYGATAGLTGGSAPVGIVVNRKTGKVYVAESGNGTVNVYSSASPTTVRPQRRNQ